MRRAKRAAINREGDSSLQECQGFQLLPEPLSMEILLRLMPKTILICRCVCKSWLSIISDPNFSHMHISRSHPGFLIYKRNMAQTRLVEFTQIEQCCESGNASPFQLEKLRFKPNTSLPPKMSVYFELLNSCNGLLLLSSKFKGRDETLYICNPVLGDYITLPHAPIEQTWENKLCCVLGYSDITNEYKVLKTTGGGLSDGRNIDFEAQVYTIGTGVWKSIGKAPVVKFTSYLNVVLRGNHHWLPICGTIRSIHVFSFETEQFRTHKIPPSIEKEQSLKLGVFEGYLLLCVFDNLFNATRFDMWVMKDYGVQESWTKIFVVEKDLNKPCFPCVSEPVVFFRFGDIMFWYNDLIVVSYNLETKTIKEETRVADTRCSHLICYNPCFFSLHDVTQGEEVKRVGRRKKKPFWVGSSSSAGSAGRQVQRT